MGSRERRVVFVTIGTTCFDALVKAVDSEEVKEALLHKGYTDLLIQMGRGTYMPSKSPLAELYFANPLLVVFIKMTSLFDHLRSLYKFSRHLCDKYLQIKNSKTITLVLSATLFIADYIREASLVISHAGSGSIFETLRLGKPLIVVVNEGLMDNHQSELAEELADRKDLFCARPQTLQETVEAMDLNNLLPYIPGDAKQVVTLINKFLGFPVD
ncbi:hypothetical protein PVAP13_7KG082016 [Panicum virgatum]|uniref:Glycosyl transferase family 28 C-terminal domain-containing protein n=1 Tax=Panicum virgatum TaxID=38727 RepID=A0A8T0Q890_PANVG|nr:hypothetical protein PVAP13_7KG082016 [Panicum virgatum]